MRKVLVPTLIFAYFSIDGYSMDKTTPPPPPPLQT